MQVNWQHCFLYHIKNSPIVQAPPCFVICRRGKIRETSETMRDGPHLMQFGFRCPLEEEFTLTPLEGHPKRKSGSPVSAPDPMSTVLSDPNMISDISGWDLDIRQIDRGPMRATAAVRQSASVGILKFNFDRRVHQTGESPQGTITLGIPSRTGLQSWRGKVIDGPSILGFGDGDELCAVSDAGFSGFTVSMSKPETIALADRLQLPLQDSLLSPNAIGLQSAHRTAFLWTLLEHLVSTDSRMTAAQDQEIIAGFLEVVSGAEVYQDKSTLRQRNIAVNKALAIMQDNLRDTLLVAEICDMAGVSWRSLDRGFKERFGIGPKAYLMRLKLSRVRSELIAHGHVRKVSDIANDWGFWHMGQFAKDYARQYGTLPSEVVD
ncbi:helix-turn-helix domain-containing protein [Shimia sp. SDUM112013]|uniref:AraC family transcriptional regulator n=1 Tax=Shimia sp. SDUM112013 TaxID=3136160 RepID=UPI0032EDDCF7